MKNIWTTKENRLVFKGATPEAGSSGKAEKAVAAPNSATAEMKEAKELTLGKAKELVERARKEFNEKADKWKAKDNGQSDKFRGIVEGVQTELDTENKTWDGMFTAAGVDMTKKMEAKDVTGIQDLGKKFEAKLGELEKGAEGDRVEQKMAKLKERGKAVDAIYTKENLKAAVDSKVKEYVDALGLEEGPLKKSVIDLITKNLEKFGAKSLETLGALEEKFEKKKDGEIPEKDIDDAMAILSNQELFPDKIEDLWTKPEGIAINQQTNKFVKAVEILVKGFAPIIAGPEGKKAFTKALPKIEALLKNISDGKASPSEFIPESRQIETEIMIGYLKDVFKDDKEMLNVIDSVFQTYALGKWNNKVDQAKVKLLIEKIQQDKALSGKINIQLEGGADSAEFSLLASKYETVYKHYTVAAGRLLAQTSLQADPYVKANQAVIKEVSEITDKAGFEKFLTAHSSDLASLKSATGPFNTILAYMRMENVAGESLVNLADKPSSIYLETGKTGDKYRYSLVMTYNPDAVADDATDLQSGAKVAPVPGPGVVPTPGPGVVPTPGPGVTAVPGVAPVLTDSVEPVVPKAGEVVESFGIKYTVDKGMYTIVGDSDYTHPLDETEFKAITGQEKPSDPYMKEKIGKHIDFLKGEPEVDYDPADKTIEGIYSIDDDNFLTFSYDIQTGKVTLYKSEGDVTPLFKDMSQPTLKKALQYGIDLSKIESKDGDPDKALKDALIAGAYEKALEVLAKAPVLNYPLIAEVIVSADLLQIQALPEEIQKKINLVKVMQNFSDMNKDRYDKLVALTGKDPVREDLTGANMEALLDLKPSADIIKMLFDVEENQTSEKLATAYLTTDAFDADDSYKDANIAAIVLYKGDVAKLSEAAVSFVIANFDEIKAKDEAKATKIVTGYLEKTEVTDADDDYAAAYALIYNEEVIPTSVDVWAKGMLATPLHDVVSELPKGVLEAPNASKYLDAWAATDNAIVYEGASISDPQSLDRAKKTLAVLKTCTHPQNINGTLTLSDAITAYLGGLPTPQEFADGFSKEAATEKLVAVAVDAKASDADRLAAIDLLETDAYKKLDADGEPTEAQVELTKALQTLKADLWYKAGSWDKFENTDIAFEDFLSAPKRTMVNVMTMGIDSTSFPTAYQLDELLANVGEVGKENLYTLSQNADLPDWQKMRILETLGLGIEGNPLKETLLVAENIEQDIYNALNAKSPEEKKAALDAAFAKFDAEPKKWPKQEVLEQLMVLALENGYTDKAIGILKDKDNTVSVDFIYSVFEKYKELPAADKIEIAKAKELYGTALGLFEKNEGLEFSFENIKAGLDNDTLNVKQVLAVISQAGKKITLDNGETAWTTPLWCFQNIEEVKKYDEPTRKVIYENLQTEGEKVEVYILHSKEVLTKEEAAKYVTLADGGKRFGADKLAISQISPEVATELAKFPGALTFDNLSAIDVVSAKALMQAQGAICLKDLSPDAVDGSLMEVLLTKQGPAELALAQATFNKLQEYATWKGLERYDAGQAGGYKVRVLAELQGLDLDLNGTGDLNIVNPKAWNPFAKGTGWMSKIGEDNETVSRKAFADEVVTIMAYYGIVGKADLRPVDLLEECGFTKEENVDYIANPTTANDKAENAAVMKKVEDYLATLATQRNDQTLAFKALPISIE